MLPHAGACDAPALLALAAGAAAEKLESLDDDAIRDEALAALRGMFGAAAVPTPTDVIVTRCWIDGS